MRWGDSGKGGKGVKREESGERKEGVNVDEKTSLYLDVSIYLEGDVSRRGKGWCCGPRSLIPQAPIRIG